NTMPRGRLWIPLLDRWWGWLVLLVMVSPILFPASRIAFGHNPVFRGWLELVASLSLTFTNRFGFRSVDGLGGFFLRLLCFLLAAFLPAVIGGLFWFVYGARGWFGSKKVELVQRKRLSAVMAQLDGTGVDDIERLVHDDAVYAVRVGK